MISSRDFDDMAALSVFQSLDPYDQKEAELTRGAGCTGFGLWADWRAARAAHILSIVAHVSDAPNATAFAVLALGHTGQAGVAQAALLARNHQKYRRPLAQLALAVRQQMPRFCLERGIYRIEARSWADHPRASKFLEAVGFSHEVDMPGFGANGAVTFCQFAWHSPEIKRGA